jgi:hypothetical protein
MPTKKGTLGGNPRVDIIIVLFRKLQDLDFQKMRYRTDILGLMCGLTVEEMLELCRRQPLLKEYR